MNNDPQIVKTADGSDTIYLPELDETYHSIFGAVQEANHVFIVNGIGQVEKQSFTIFEMGFGTGLNALLAAKFAIENKRHIHYTSIEKFPLSMDLLEHLSYAGHSKHDEILFQKLHEAEWDKSVQIDTYFEIHKIKDDILNPDLKIKEDLDLIFFDAFSPSKQSELWDEKVFKLLFNVLNNHGKLVTYSSAGVVKQALRSAGFKVKRLTGPPGKHHILLATKEQNLND